VPLEPTATTNAVIINVFENLMAASPADLRNRSKCSLAMNSGTRTQLGNRLLEAFTD
jgi:hypothetical protein